MTKCKRPHCEQEAEVRPRYEGYCSLKCMDYDELQQERDNLAAHIKQLEATLALYMHAIEINPLIAKRTLERVRIEHEKLATHPKQLEAAEESQDVGSAALTSECKQYTLRPALAEFAEAQEQVLRVHDERKGGWSQRSTQWLLQRLMNETEELHSAIYSRNVIKIKHECCDIANFAMMIFDVSTGKKPSE